MRGAIRPVAVAFFATAAALLGDSAEVRAHARLVAASPRASSRLDASPATVDLWFDEVLDEGFHEVSVVPDDAPASSARNRAGAVSVDPDDRTHLVAPLERLHDGSWVVLWRVLSRDGHGARGRHEFRVGRRDEGR